MQYTVCPHSLRRHIVSDNGVSRVEVTDKVATTLAESGETPRLLSITVLSPEHAFLGVLADSAMTRQPLCVAGA